MSQIEKIVKENPHQLRSFLDDQWDKNQEGVTRQILSWIPTSEATVFLPLLEWITDQGRAANPFFEPILNRIKSERELHHVKGMLTYYSYIDSYQAIKSLERAASHFVWDIQNFIQKTVDRMKKRCIDFLLVEDLKKNLGQPLKVKKIVDSMRNHPSPLYDQYLLELSEKYKEDHLDAIIFLAQAFKNQTALKALLQVFDQILVMSQKFFEFFELLKGDLEPPSDVVIQQLIEMERVDDLVLRLKDVHNFPTSFMETFKSAMLRKLKGIEVTEPLETKRPPGYFLELSRTIGMVAKSLEESDILEIVGEKLVFHPWSKHIFLALLAGNQVSEGKSLLLQWFDEAEDDATKASILKVLKNYHLEDIPPSILEMYKNPPEKMEDHLNHLIANSGKYALILKKILELPESQAIRTMRSITAVRPTGNVDIEDLFVRPNASVQYLESAIDLMVHWRPNHMEKIASSFLNAKTSYAVRFDALSALMQSGPLWWKKLSEILEKSTKSFAEETLNSALSLIEKNHKLTFDQGVQLRPWRMFLNSGFENIVKKAVGILLEMDGDDFVKVDEWITELNRQLCDNPFPSAHKLTHLRTFLKQKTNPDLPKNWQDFEHDYPLFNDFNKSRWIRLLSQIEVNWFEDDEVQVKAVSWAKLAMQYFGHSPNVLKDLVQIAKRLGLDNFKDELDSFSKSEKESVRLVAQHAMEASGNEKVLSRIVIVDDSLVIGKRLQSFLQKMGYEANYITEPRELDDLNLQTVDLFIVDYFLGQTTGSQEAFQLIDLGFKGEFIFITSGRNPEIKMSLNLLPKKWPILLKPFPLNKLVDLITDFKVCPTS